MGRRLTDKQRLWVEAYLETWNATEAARRAGYNGTYDSLRAIGSQNLAKPKLQAEIESRLAEAAMSADETLARITRIARGEYGRGFKITTSEMLRALELLAKHHALLTDRIELNWRDELEREGVPASEVFEKLVEKAVADLASDNA